MTADTPTGQLNQVLEARIGTHVKKLEQAIVAAKSDALRPLGTTVPQYAALLAISRLQPTSAAQLARVCLTTPQTMSTILANLEAKGLIQRQVSAIHQKLIEVVLTDRGQDLLKQADEAAQAIESSLLSLIGPDRFDSLIEITRIVTEHLRQGPPGSGD